MLRRWPWKLTLLSMMGSVLLLGYLPRSSYGQYSGTTEWQARPAALLVLPFANYTGRAEALETVRPLILSEVRQSGLLYMSDSELRPLLRQHRIRVYGMIEKEGAQILRRMTGASYLLIGSYDIYRTDTNPEVALSARIVSIQDMTVVHAAHVAATGEDSAGLFGLGRIEDAGELAEGVVRRLFEEMGRPLVGRGMNRRSTEPCSRAALVPFDNVSGYPYGAHVVTNIVLSELTADGYVVLEPGYVHELFLDERVMPRGQLDLSTLAALRSQLDMCFVITGEVERFRPALGSLEAAVPQLSFGARMLDASNGRLLMTFDDERDGAQSETVLGMGRERSLGKLTRKAAKKLVHRINDKRKKYLAKQD